MLYLSGFSKVIFSTQLKHRILMRCTFRLQCSGVFHLDIVLLNCKLVKLILNTALFSSFSTRFKTFNIESYMAMGYDWQ